MPRSAAAIDHRGPALRVQPRPASVGGTARFRDVERRPPRKLIGRAMRRQERVDRGHPRPPRAVTRGRYTEFTLARAGARAASVASICSSGKKTSAHGRRHQRTEGRPEVGEGRPAADRRPALLRPSRPHAALLDPRRGVHRGGVRRRLRVRRLVDPRVPGDPGVPWSPTRPRRTSTPS
jgi:hypothetical protein